MPKLAVIVFCLSQIVPPAPPPPTPIMLKVHVDIAFSPAEYVSIIEATALLEEQTKGLFLIQLVQDAWYPYPRSMPYMPESHWGIRKAKAEHQRITEWDKALKTTVLGLCGRDIKTIDLVPDRIRTGRDLTHVAMHELLHAIGIEHIKDDETSIMYPYLTVGAESVPLVLSDRDRQAFCAIAHCKPEMLK